MMSSPLLDLPAAVLEHCLGWLDPLSLAMSASVSTAMRIAVPIAARYVVARVVSGLGVALQKVELAALTLEALVALEEQCRRAPDIFERLGRDGAAAPQPLARRIAHRTLLVAYREALGLRNEVLALHLPAIAGLLAPGRPSATQHRGLCLARKLSALPSCVAALTPRVEPLLVADDPRLTVLAIECLGAFGIDRHSDAIARHLGSSHHTCRVAALTALAQSEQARASRKERRGGQTDRRRRMHAPRHARTRTRPSQPPRRLASPMRRRSSRSSRTRTATTRRRRR